MDSNARSKRAYDEIADYYENTFDGKFTKKFKQLLLASMAFKDHDSILDVACGNGSFLSTLRNHAAIKGYGVDISGKMIENAAHNCPDMVFSVAGCEQIPFDSGTMDIITVCAAYHHFPRVNLFASEAGRLLKPNGDLYIAEIYLPTVLRRMLNPFVPLSKAGDVRFYSPAEIVETFLEDFTQQSVMIKNLIQIVHLKRK